MGDALNASIQIGDRRIGPSHPVYVVAELSANHGREFARAVELTRAAKQAGADAVKLQTYTADTITLDCDSDRFRIKGTVWEGRTLYDLYGEAYMPWEWQPKLKAVADGLGLHLFSTPFDDTAVGFLENMNVPAYKIASFELVDLPLIRRVAATGKPMIMSTGMATLGEIEEAVTAAREAGCREIVLLKCTSAYPAPPSEMNLQTIPHMAQTFGVPVGLSDHTLGTVAAIAGVALGACIIEKHFTLSRSVPGPDSAFSLEPHEFKAMVAAVREAGQALGVVRYEPTEREKASLVFRRSLYVVADMKAGEPFTRKNVRSIRPGHGLPPKYFDQVLTRRAARDIERGAPLTWQDVDIPSPTE
jgi:N-acetylneuraminate synthase